MVIDRAFFTRIHDDAQMPTYGTEESAACDLYLLEDVSFHAGKVVLARTGIVALPPVGYHWELALRSSTPRKYPGLVLANGIGVIDSDYCGPEDEIKIPVLNTNASGWHMIKKGTRIAQLILRENLHPEIGELTVEELTNIVSSSRGGFGSTGE